MDDRTYIRLHDGMPDHPKIVELSHGAFRLYVESMCWCSRYLTDGIVPLSMMKRMRGYSAGAVRELSKARLIEDGTGSQWAVHDYTEHQRTAAAVALIRESKKAASAAANHEKWHQARGIKNPACALCCVPDASQVGSSTDAGRISEADSEIDPDRSQETETEKRSKSRELDHVGSDDDPDFAAFWSVYLRKIGKGQARKAWRSAVIGKKADPAEIIATATEFATQCRRDRTETKFIPHPATWLNGERWGDEEDNPAGTAPELRRITYPTSPWAG